MPRTYYVKSATDLGHLPRRLFFIDSSVLVGAAFECRHTCVRIVESELPYAYTKEMMQEVETVGKSKFGGFGSDYFERLLKRENFSKIVVYGKTGLVPRELKGSLSVTGISPEDQLLISLIWAGFIRGEEYHLLSVDSHLEENENLQKLFLRYAQHPWERIYHPIRFCKDFDEELKPYAFTDRLRTGMRRASYDLQRRFG